MRTKALLLAAAFAAVGVATSMAQVYSVNAVGYVNTSLKVGFQLVSNPLTAADNTIGNLFKNIQGTIPGGFSVYKFKNGNFVSTTWDEFDLKFSGGAETETTVPGEGVFTFNNGSAPLTVTFVGEVVQGPTSTAIPTGFSVKSSVVPQAGAPDSFKNTDGTAAPIPALPGDSIFRYNTTTKNYNSFSFDEFDLKWVPDLPSIPVGEAFFYFRNGAATTWNRTFSVN